MIRKALATELPPPHGVCIDGARRDSPSPATC